MVNIIHNTNKIKILRGRLTENAGFITIIYYATWADHTHTTAYSRIHQRTQNCIQNYILRSIKTQKKTKNAKVQRIAGIYAYAAVLLCSGASAETQTVQLPSLYARRHVAIARGAPRL